MKKRFICVALTAALLLSVPMTASADSTGISFTAVGDNLLELSYMPAYSGGVTYVPAGKAFSAFGVYLNYFDSDAIALLYNGSKQVFFDMNNGGASDSMGTAYDVSAIYRGGQVYVPLAWVCGYFGLSYSYITGVGNGDIVRIKNGSEVLSDSDFLSAAATLMKTRYNEYYGMVAPSTPAPGESSTPSPGDDDHNSTYISLAFIGIPDARFLDTLDRYGYSVSFFVTEQQARDNADTIRRIYGSGHNIGVYCQSAPEESESACDAVFGVCQVMPTIMASPESIANDCKEYGADHGLAYYDPYISVDASTENRSAIVSRLEDSSGAIDICVELSDATLKMLSSLLSYITTEEYSVTPLRETFQ